MEAGMDRYTKTVLTVIAGALVYLCIVMTAFPTVSAQQTAARPGDPTGPAQVVVVGWNPAAAIPITTAQPLHVVTERSTGLPDRMVLVGWEEGGNYEHAGTVHGFSGPTGGIPVVMHSK
ncbi:MAG: hypothetical protein ABI983_02925 [Acidobacteriota bacterium]